MDMYRLSRYFWDFAFENPTKIKPIHCSIYFFAVEHCNRLGWKRDFGLPTSMVLEAIGIKSYSVYKKAFDDLINFGFFEIIQYSKNQYSSNVIALKENYKANCKANTKALDKALSKHISKHVSKQCQSTVSINKQDTSIQDTIEREKAPQKKENSIFEKFKNTLELDLDSCLKESIENEQWLEAISMNNNLKSIEITKKYIGLFYKKLQNEGVAEKSINDFKSHFARWLSLELKNKKNEKNWSIDTKEGRFDLLNAVAEGIARAEFK